MSRHPMDPRYDKSRRGMPNDRLEQARKAKALLLERQVAPPHMRMPSEAVKAPVATDTPAPLRDSKAHLEALAQLPLWRLGDKEQLRVSGPYLQLAGIALQAMETKEREAVLGWPDFTASPSALAVLLALADSAAAPRLRVGDLEGRAPPAGLRALVYPYSSTAHRGIRQIYADKDHVGQVNILHQLRSTRQAEDEGLSDFHKALARSKTLTGLALDGQTYDEFRHPCLDELMPFGPCRGSDGRLGLLWRVRTKTDLKHISRSGKADDPETARFFLFGLRASEPLVPSLKSLNKRLDLVLIDLGTTGRSRLGRDWLPRVKQFLEQLDDRVGPVATIAVTDDPWAFDALRFEGLLRGPARKAKTPAPAKVIFAASPDIATVSSESPPAYSQLKKQEVAGFSGEVAGVLQALRGQARKAEELKDAEAAGLLRQIIGTIRRCSALPASRDDFSAYLEDAVGNQAAADLQAAYRISSAASQLRSSVGPWAQMFGKDRGTVLAHVERVWNNTADLTPMAPMLRDTIAAFLHKSSSTAVLFQKDMLADFAAHALSRDAEIGGTVQIRLEKEMLLFLDRNGLADISRLPGPRRNYIKTLIAVAPTRAQLLKLLAREWLPDNLIVLGDSDTLQSCAADARRLSGHKELGVIADRLSTFAAKADAVVHRASLPKGPDEPHEDVEFPTSAVVNLAGNVRPDQESVRLKLSGDQVLLARPKTRLIVQDTSRAVPVFVEAEAKSVEIGDKVCVIGDAFLEMARPMLNITVRAAEEIRDYHELVLERFEALPGATQAARLAHLVATMALPEVSVQRAHYWIDLDSQRQVDLHEIIPHAPRDRATFLAFMKALSVSDAKSHHYWTWAVIAQRSSRLRAAISFHDAYRTLLVDNYAAQSSNPARASEIRRLKAAAEDFVSQVVEKETVRGDGHEAA